MQHIPLTLGLLCAIVVGIVLLRLRWRELRPGARRLLTIIAPLCLALFVLSYATHWTTRSPRFNTLLYWVVVASWLFVLSLHTLSRPRWLTTATALLLAIPLLSASVFLPLTNLFDPPSEQVTPLGHRLFLVAQPFQTSPSNSGTDIDIVYRPPLLPFLQHSRLGGRFFDTHCDSHSAQVTLQPDASSVFVRCPAWPSSAGPVDPGAVIRLH